MLNLSPSRDNRDACTHLNRLINPDQRADLCSGHIRRLHRRFITYAETCPVPLPAPGLIITPEIRHQSEIYLPLSGIAAAFNNLYQSVLRYSPIFSSSPFHHAHSWADVYAALPARFQFSANPARLLEELRNRRELLIDFLFVSFLPSRFYGGFRRYPLQREFLGVWLNEQSGRTFHCLDAACGTGEDSYGVAQLLLENGCKPDDFRVEGWTLEPLEVWAAVHARFPHDPDREAVYRRETEALVATGVAELILFRTADLRNMSHLSEKAAICRRFDMILCNGLLGGPILHGQQDVQQVVFNLAGLLAADGILLIADSFHGGWKQKHPQEWLKVHLESVGLEVRPAGEGICAARRA